MKKLKIIFSAAIVLTGMLVTILACSDNDIQSNPGENGTQKRNMSMARVESDADTLAFEINDDSYDLKYTASIYGSEVNSNLRVYKNSDLVFETHYNFNTQDEHWRLKQAPRVIETATVLKQTVSLETVQEVNTIVNKAIQYIHAETIETKKRDLVGSINFHNAIINAVIRAYKENTDCNCAPHPAFIIDKAFFNCQEDQFYNVSELKTALEQYAENNEMDESTANLMAYLGETNETEIRFDDYYNFYLSKENFKTFIEDALNGETARKRCWLGLGSSYGCCGNYSGCCLYVSPICHVHDAMCTNCRPSWFCLPGCKPDKPVKPVKSLSVY